MIPTLQKRTKCKLTVVFLLLSLLTFGQNVTVTGTILSAEDEQPIIGANVSVVGTQLGTSTDFNGVYTISVPPDGTLLFSYIGFISQEIAVNGQSTINVTMATDRQVLEDVIVVGYKKEIKSNISSAISTVKAENINHLPLSGLDQALQGQAAGVQVTQVTGAPGEGQDLRGVGRAVLGAVPGGNVPGSGDRVRQRPPRER